MRKRGAPSRLQIITSLYSRAKLKVIIGSRGSAKSSGGIANAIKRRSLEMPRGNFMIYTDTLKNAKNNTLPNTITGLGRLGFVRDQHFFVGHKPPKKWGWPLPYRMPEDTSDSIFMYTGAVFSLSTRDRARGQDNDGILADEGLLINKEMFSQSAIPTLRGHKEYFGDHPEHHGIEIYSSMPFDPDSTWLLNYGDYYKELGINNEPHYRAISELTFELSSAKTRTAQAEIIKAALNEKKQIKHCIAKGSAYGNSVNTFYAEFDFFDNIHNLGIDYLRLQRSTLYEPVFRIEVCNEKMRKALNGFYPYLSESHLYGEEVNYEAMASEEEPSSLWQRDINPNEPIDLCMDFGGRLHGMNILQSTGEIERVVKSLYVKKGSIREAANLFLGYFRGHRHKVMYYYPDSTGDKNYGDNEENFIEKFIRLVREGGWTVIDMSNAKNHSPKFRHELWKIIHAEEPGAPKYRYNREHAYECWLSQCKTKMLLRGNKVKKDKRPEQNNNIPQEEAPHLGDALDYHAATKYGHLLEDREAFSTTL